MRVRENKHNSKSKRRNKTYNNLMENKPTKSYYKIGEESKLE